MHLDWQIHDGKGPHLLLVHGFLCSRAQWLWNLTNLAEVCRPVTVELWGHGRSPAPSDPACYAPDRIVDEFESIRAELGAGEWFVLGYSLGAGLTIRYALRHAQRVTGHIFTNSTSGLAAADQTGRWREEADDAARRVIAGGRAALERIPVHPRRATKLPDPLHQALMADAARLDPTGVANILRYTNPNVSVRSDLHRNTRPALLVCGAGERRFQPHRAFAAANMPGLEIVDVEAGHGVNMEAHEQFNAAVSSFIRCHT
jgi:pimeloyl-ACP methyl ester carboxylesterase